MSKIAEMLPKDVIAAMAAMFGTEGAEVAAKPQVEDRPIAKGSGFHLIRLLANKHYDGEAVVFDSDGEAVEFEDGSEVTYGDLATVEENAVRQDGSVGRNYPVVWGLTQGQASGAIEHLEACPDKPKQASAGRRSNTTRRQPAAKPQDDGMIRELIAAMAAMQHEIAEMRQPAKPVPVAGHRKVATAKPSKPQAATVDLTEGQIVTFNGEPWQVTVHANGRPALRKTVI